MAAEPGEYSGAQARYYDQYFTGLEGEGEFYLEEALSEGGPVLELGCGNGGNLIPVAVAHPECELLGVDLAPGHIETGRARAQKLDLRNLRLEAMSFAELDESAGAFDFIIVHGLFSWIPPELQERLLQTSKRHLAAQGVLFMSYNTYPGWYVRKAVREMLVFHTRDLVPLTAQVVG